MASKRLGDRDGVLAGHGVDDEERVVGLTDAEMRRTWSIISASMARRPAVSTMQHVAAEAAGLVGAGLGGGDRVARLAEHRHADLAPEGAQLLDGGGALEVGADQQRVAALLLEPAGQLGRVGGLAGALQAGHQHDGGRLAGVGDGIVSPPSASMSSSLTILMTCWAGFSASDRSVADGPLADAVEHGLDGRRS